ncbi:hypothetical protein EUTSA_v10029508mg [Eutrema salsugineum]|uniref:S-protein homolog n=1 Tax=Eutrema salsugineum TaxID=72664 RepID=V4LF84_EUTSA|nr:hypothetical protein EUTSA_v10029508mg [Eutrema salsugineum]
MNNCSCVFLLIIALFVGLSEGFGRPCAKNTVTIQNKLASGSNLEVHCQSLNGDLGFHMVKFNDPPYNFSFGDNMFILTKWNCLLRQGPNMEYIQDFRAYEASPEGRRCG